MNDQDSTNIANNSTNPQPVETAGNRQELARHLPFLLRAWWLRETKEFQGTAWQEDPYITGPVWSSYSDPMCDMAGLDYAYDAEK